MDPTGLLEAVLAMAVYPGAVFVALATLLRLRLAGRRPGPRGGGPPPAISLVPVMAAVVAAAMLPMVGSPALRLPPPAGAGTNLLALIVLLAIAVDLASASRPAAMLAAAAALPTLALAATQGTLDAETISRVSGGTAPAARALAALLLVAASAVCGGSRPASLVASVLALGGAAMVIPATLGGQPPVLCAVACLGVVVVAGVGARWRHHVIGRMPVLGGGAIALAGTVLALVSPRL